MYFGTVTDKGRFMAQVYMTRGDLFPEGPAQEMENPTVQSDFLLLALSAPAEAHPGQPEAGELGPGQ